MFLRRLGLGFSFLDRRPFDSVDSQDAGAQISLEELARRGSGSGSRGGGKGWKRKKDLRNVFF